MMASAQAGKQTRKPLSWKRIVGYAISLVIVIANLVGVGILLTARRKLQVSI